MDLKEIIKEMKEAISLIKELNEPMDEKGGGDGIELTGEEALLITEELSKRNLENK